MDAKTLVGEDGRASGIGYVRFATPEAAKAAIEVCDSLSFTIRAGAVCI